jgi:hypothetical protein
MFRSRIGQVMSVATHWARFMPQPQVHRVLLARRSASLRAPDDSEEKSTTRMSFSSHGTPAVSDRPYTISATTAMTRLHLAALTSGEPRRRRLFTRACFFMFDARLSHGSHEGPGAPIVATTYGVAFSHAVSFVSDSCLLGMSGFRPSLTITVGADTRRKEAGWFSRGVIF